MTRSILIAGADHSEVLLKARTLGLRTILVAPDHEALTASAADITVVADIESASELARVARAHQVHGLYPGIGAAVHAAAGAARQLGLAGPEPDAVALMQDTVALRATLTRHGYACPRTGVAVRADLARAVATEIGLPVIVGPAHARAGRRTWRVEYIEDLSLAFAQAVKGNESGEALIEAVVTGPRYYVDCVVSDSIVFAGLLGRVVSDAPFDFDEGLFAPPELDAATQHELTQTARGAVATLGIGQGCVRVDLAATPTGPFVFGVRMARPCGRIPSDLIAPVYGVDLLGAALRMAVGEPIDPTPALGVPWALRWLSSGSGVVTGVANLEAARAVHGVHAVEVLVSPGEVVGHIVDETSRDRIGYALATGETAAAALAAANEACSLCRILTEPSRGHRSVC